MASFRRILPGVCLPLLILSLHFAQVILGIILIAYICRRSIDFLQLQIMSVNVEYEASVMLHHDGCSVDSAY